MRKIYFYAFFAMIAVAFCSCDMFNKKTEPFSQAGLHGLWLEEGTQHYVRFLEQRADTATFEWGKEWNVDQKVYEDRLEDYGNGWFKYELKFVDNENKLTQINMMEQNQAAIPQVYVVTVLTAKRLEYYKDGYKNEKKAYNKVTE